MHDPNSDPIAAAINDILRGPEKAQADKVFSSSWPPARATRRRG